VATTTPRNHDLSGLGSAGCLECHDQSQHLSGAMRIRDPDPTDAFVWSAAQPDNLCRTCHDNGTTRAFGNQAPRNVQTPYAASAHSAEGYRCTTCHSVHSSTGGPLFVDPASGTCMSSGCHNNLTATFALAPSGQISTTASKAAPASSSLAAAATTPTCRRRRPTPRSIPTTAG
jgi:predicted CXXCH cytochrome family protein